MYGNVAEWCTTADGGFVLAGGSYRDPKRTQAHDARRAPDKNWNMSDPQLPKSKWWLTDGSFCGLRVVCDLETEDETPGD